MCYGLLNTRKYTLNIYTWNIKQTSVLNAIKTAKNGQHIDSPLIMLKSLKFILKLFPNGDEPDDAGNLDVCLHLISFKFAVYVGIDL